MPLQVSLILAVPTCDRPKRAARAMLGFLPPGGSKNDHTTEPKERKIEPCATQELLVRTCAAIRSLSAWEDARRREP